MEPGSSAVPDGWLRAQGAMLTRPAVALRLPGGARMSGCAGRGWTAGRAGWVFPAGPALVSFHQVALGEAGGCLPEAQA